MNQNYVTVKENQDLARSKTCGGLLVNKNRSAYRDFVIAREKAKEVKLLQDRLNTLEDKVLSLTNLIEEIHANASK